MAFTPFVGTDEFNMANFNKAFNQLNDSKVDFTEAQTMTDEQKTRARGNIDAAPGGFGWGDSAEYTFETNEEFKAWFMQNVAPKCARNAFAASVHIKDVNNYRMLIIASGDTSTAEIVIVGYLYNGLELRANINYDGNWQPWEWVNPPMQLGVEYRTTERYNGKPVYVQLMNWGRAPTQGTVKIVATPENSRNQQLVWAQLTYYGITFPKYKGDGALSMYIYVAQGSNQFQIYSPGEDWSTNGDILAIVKYTKSTD